MAVIDRTRHLDAFQQRNLSLSEWFVFSIPGHFPVLVANVPTLAARMSEGDPRGTVSVTDCEQALKSLLKRGWLRVIADADRAKIEQAHRSKKLPDPVYGFP